MLTVPNNSPYKCGFVFQSISLKFRKVIFPSVKVGWSRFILEQILSKTLSTVKFSWKGGWPFWELDGTDCSDEVEVGEGVLNHVEFSDAVTPVVSETLDGAQLSSI